MCEEVLEENSGMQFRKPGLKCLSNIDVEVEMPGRQLDM